MIYTNSVTIDSSTGYSIATTTHFFLGYVVIQTQKVLC